MTEHRLPGPPGDEQRRVLPGPALPAARSAFPPGARPEPLPLPPVHEPGGFPLGSAPGRDQCWALLGEQTRKRLQELAGEVVEWCAWEGDGADRRPEAWVFGPLGLCHAVPEVRDGRRVYRIERLRLDPAALRRQPFRSEPPRRGSRASGILRRDRAASARPSPDGSGAAGAARPARARPLDLSAESHGLLGNFPAEVQDFLQRPFVNDDRRVMRYSYYEESVELTQQRLFVVFCLSGDRSVTLVTGHRLLKRGRSMDQAEWELECYHASVRTPGR